MHLNRNQYGRYFLKKLSEWLMLPAMVEVTHFYGTVYFVTVGTWDGTGYCTMFSHTKFSGIPRNFSQFRAEY